MEFNIRQEHPADHKEVFNLIRKAFEKEKFSDHKEHLLVERLRSSDAFVPELSLVAEAGNIIVGHILLKKIKILSGDEQTDSLTLAPVTVLPEYQHKGIGGALIKEAHKRAKEIGYRSVILLGHENYYPRFGYRRAKSLGIKLPFDVPEENCMAIELIRGSLNNVKGTVKYPDEFHE